MYILNVFFITLYEKERDFYEQFGERIKAARGAILNEDSVL